MPRLLVCAAVLSLLFCLGASAEFVNFESAHVHPLDMSPNGARLAVCNTADNRLEIYNLTSGSPVWEKSIAVGLDPVSVRWVSNTRALVVNHVSDSVSVVNVTAGAVVLTIPPFESSDPDPEEVPPPIAMPDEPCDVIVAGPANRAFVTCQQENKIAVIDYNTGLITNVLTVLGENPRAMAVSPDKSKVYAAVFESGNKTTILGGGADDLSVIPFPYNVVSDGATPHGGLNPAPNNGGVFSPLKNPANGAAPHVGLIVKQNSGGNWLDDTGANWTNFVSGTNAHFSGRPQGWQLLDHDLVVIDANTLSVSYVDTLMNINMAMAVNPASGLVSVVGTEAINEVRFEPKVNGIFVRVMMATANDSARTMLKDLNADHLAAAQQAQNGVANAYHDHDVPPAERAKSIGDPRGIAWNAAGTRAYITGMGSNNMIVVNTAGARVGQTSHINLREGPTGVAVDDTRGSIYVLNRFHGSLSVVSMDTETETANIPFHDSTPAAIKAGRKHLYDTRKTSGLGQVSCGSCHVDARFDRLAWDLGDPAGDVKGVLDMGFGGDLNLIANPLMDPTDFEDFHPMKGPMTTQTLVGIIGHEPFHWRGDRLGLEEFNPAFTGLLGDDVQLTAQEMQEFEDFLATIYFPPNPFRHRDNSLPTDLPLDGHHATGDNDLDEGDPLPNGNAQRGLDLYRGAPGPSGIPTRLLDQQTFTCVSCHTLPSGDGTNSRFNGNDWDLIASDPTSHAAHIAMVSIDGSTNRSIKVPHLQPVYEKTGYSMVNRGGDKTSLNGFGYLHDGTIDSVERFFAAGGPHDGAFRFADDQEVADMVAFMLSFSGSDFNETPALQPFFNPPGTPSPDVHAGVGEQLTFSGLQPEPVTNKFVELGQSSERIEMILTGVYGGVPRGFLHVSGDTWQQDENDAPTITLDAIIAATRGTSDALTFTIVVAGTGERLALDRDGDGYYNHTEALDGSDPADPESFGPQPDGEAAADGEGGIDGATDGEGSVDGAPEGEGVEDGEGGADGEGNVDGEGVADGEGDVDGEGEPIPTEHSVDRDGDFKIDFEELLRPIQFYNAPGYRCKFPQEQSEDGLMPGQGFCAECERYTMDYQLPRCRISLSELLRVIQIYSIGEYHACESADFFCPGPAPETR